MHRLAGFVFFALVIAAASRAFAQAGPANSTDSRYGPFGLLDRRSVYGTFWFPEPLNADEADVDNEVRLDYFHGEKSGHQENEIRAEVEKAFGLVTVEISGGYESSHDRAANEFGELESEREEGFGNIELAARFPFFQYVSDDGNFDDTFVFAFELAPPTNTKVSKDTEIVPKVFNLLKLGEHVSVQTGLGISTLIGPEERGASALEYNVVLGYELTRDVLPLPGILSTVPIVEIDGETPINHDERGETSLFATVGARFNFKTIDRLPLQPRLGLGYVFPLNDNARDEFHWGIITSLIFEY